MLEETASGGDPVTLLLSNDMRLRQLNRQFRGKDKPTNVLSFVSSDRGYLGDVAIALGVVEHEAREQGKPLPDHAAHLAVHGILHLKGYDHEKASDRRRMEAIETVILSRLGVPPPYTARAYPQNPNAID